MKFVYLLFLIITIMLIGCQSSYQHNHSKEQSLLKLNDTVIFALDNSTSNVTKAIYFYEDNGKPYFVYLDDRSNYIQVFNIETKQKDHFTPIRTSGKYAIPNNLGFAIKSFDSIFIASLSGELIHINAQGEIIRRYDYNNFDELFLPIVSLSRYYSPLLFNKNEIYGMQSNGSPHYADEEIGDYKFCAKISIISGDAEILPIHHPLGFWETGIKQTFLSWDFNGKDFIMSPVYSHGIYISRDNFKIDTVVYTKSNYVNNFYMYNPNLPDDRYFRNLLINQEYFAIKYDKFRDIYYRFFWPGINEDNLLNVSNIFETYQNPPNFGIMVLNNQFEVIDEIILPNNIYSQHKFFVGAKGLYLSADHKNNPILNEDEWVFHVYTMKTTN